MIRKNKRMYSILLIVAVVASIITGCGAEKAEDVKAVNKVENVETVNSAEDVKTVDSVVTYETDMLIVHAMGEIDGQAYTNSLEAFENSYNKGIRFFEVDFDNTADHRIVAVHDWGQWLGWLDINIDEQPFRSYSHTDFMNTKTAGKYTSVDLDMVANLMVEHEDIYIITDTKRPAEKLFKDDISRIYIALEMTQEGLSDRLIVQAYNENDIKIAQKLFPDKNIIFTAYMSGLKSDQIADLCKKYPDLYGITVEKGKITEEIISAAHAVNMKIFAHTVNSDENFKALLSKGVYGLYTDNLMFEDLQ